MVEVAMAIITSQICPEPTANESNKYFPKKPANGGIPANDNKATVIEKVKNGLREKSPLNFSIVRLSFFSSNLVITAKANKEANE